MAVTSNAKAGKDEEFRHWYKEVHIPELLEVPGFVKGTRYYNDNQEVAAPYLTIYEIDSDDIQATTSAMREHSKSITQSEAIDEKSVSLQIYRLLD
jgi:antibiotic biosynthesis monooxygenase (ABM) superfamily enzyme